MEAKVINPKGNVILVFNPLKRLVAFFGSETADTISCNNLYFRKLSENIEVTFEDFGKLRLEEYDSMCGVKRKYYATKEMTRKGMKYNTKNKKKHED